MRPTLWVVKFRAIGAAEEDATVLPYVFDDHASMLAFIKQQTRVGVYVEVKVTPPLGKTMKQAKAEIESFLTTEKH